jgi:IS66 C-terminal element
MRRVCSLQETCKLNGVDPQAYFTGVLTKLVNLWPASLIDELMPWASAAERDKPSSGTKLRIDEPSSRQSRVVRKPLSRKRPLPAPEEPSTIALGQPIKLLYRRGRGGAAR